MYNSNWQEELEEEVEVEEESKIGTIIKIIVTLIIVAAIGVAGFFLFKIYVLDNTLDKKIESAEKLLENKEYEKALKKYEEAIELDPKCLKAYIGSLEIYQNMDDDKQLKKYYKKTLSMVMDYSDEEYEENEEEITDIVLMAEDIYEDDLEGIISVYEEAYDTWPENEVIKDKLVEAYIEDLEERKDSLEAEKLIKEYEKILDIDPKNKTVKAEIKKTVSDYISDLIEEEKYEKANRIFEKYGDYLDKDEYEELSEIIEKENSPVNKPKNADAIDTAELVLSYTERYMSSHQYESMMGVDGTQEATLVYNFLTANHIEGYICTDDGYFTSDDLGDYTGIGTAMYVYSGGYYFYYGEYKNGVRSGTGATFIKRTNSTYSYFVGEWDDDMPNGDGMIFNYKTFIPNGEIYESTYRGNFVDGYCDGVIEVSVECPNGAICTGSFEADNGRVEDTPNKNNEYFEEGHDYYEIVYVICQSKDKKSYWWDGSFIGNRIGAVGYGN